MPIPNTGKAGNFTQGSHDGTRLNNEFDRLYANDSQLETNVQRVETLNASTASEVAQARNGQPTLKARIDQAGDEVVAARSSSTQGGFASLDARLEADEARLTQALTATSPTEVADARMDVLGGVAATLKDAIHKGAKDLSSLTLAAVSKIVASSANIKALRVYDTSKDSDGGAWRKRCQHLSWHNETLNTATRGKTREFPALALIVAETSKVTIYDLTDSAVPMWMVLPSATGGQDGIIGFNAAAPQAIHALNGRLFVTGNKNTTGVAANVGLATIDFLADTSFVHYTSGLFRRQYTIAQRATAGGFTQISSTGIANAFGNDVAPTVLPGAPIDPASGLLVPTVAIGSDGGISVIKHDGTVVNHSTGSSSGCVYGLTWEGVGLWAKRQRTDKSGYNNLVYIENATGAATNGTIAYLPYSGWAADCPKTGSPYIPELSLSGSPAVALIAGTVAIGGASGQSDRLCLLRPDKTTPANGMIAYIAKDWISGWQPGDIRGAWLASGTAETLAGVELIANGDFTTNTNGWTAGNGATLSIDTGRLKGTVGGGGGYGYASQAISTVAGKSYTVKATYTKGISSSANIRAGASDGGNELGSHTLSVDGSYIFTFVATGPTTYIAWVFNGAAGGYAFLDDVSCRVSVEDRSVKAKGLAVYGSLTKSAVAPGAELMAYSGFSAANYLEQPYNSDLDFGTGDFCLMGWFNASVTGSSRVLLGRGFGSGSVLEVSIHATGKIQFWISKDGYATSDMVDGPILTDSADHLVCAVRRGGAIELWVDGTKYGQTTIVNSLASLSNTSAPCTIGKGATSIKLALWRATAYAPTADQIATIYNQERLLFQDNAKCLLGGSSNAVASLSYDPDTDRLAVATNNGVSYFTGLRRVDWLNGGNAPLTTSAMVAVDAKRGMSALGSAAEVGAIIPQRSARELQESAKPIPAAMASDIKRPALLNSWVDFGTGQEARYHRDDRGIVRLDGLVKSGAVGTVAFTLPVGYRPRGTKWFPIVSNSAAGIVSVAATGDVTIVSGNTAWASFDSIAFLAEQ